MRRAKDHIGKKRMKMRVKEMRARRRPKRRWMASVSETKGIEGR